MIFILSFILMIFIVSFYFSVFPNWKTYRVLWKTLLFDKNDSIGAGARIKQGRFLIKYVILCPLNLFLWTVDELFYSDYKKIKVRPVFIIGQPRSGTTFLHRTLASDKENFTSVKHIEWRFPYICLQKMVLNLKLLKKIAEKNYWSNSSAGRVASKMHPNKLSDWEEDGIFFEECFLHHFFVFLRFPYPELLHYLDMFPMLPEQVQDQILKIHGKVIQKIMFLRGGSGKYYLSKEVTSHNKFHKLLLLYPDAKFIFSFRHSSSFMSSLLALVRFSTHSKTGVDPVSIPGWESAMEQRMVMDSKLLCDLCNRQIKQENQARILFDQFTKDIIPSIEYVYRTLNFNLSKPYKKHLISLNNVQQSHDRKYNYEKKDFKGFEDFDRLIESIDLEFSQTLKTRNNK